VQQPRTDPRRAVRKALDRARSARGKVADLFAPLQFLPAPFKVALIAVDSAAVTVAGYWFLRALLLRPTGYSTNQEAAVIGVGLGLLLVLSHLVMPFKKERTCGNLVLQFVIWFGLAAAFTALADSAIRPGWDWSWLRVEMIKIPLWFGVLVPLMPVFTAIVAVVAAALAWIALEHPKSNWVRWVPTAALVALVYMAHTRFPAPGAYEPEGSEPLAIRFSLLFCSPLFVIVGLLWARRRLAAFRLVPAAFYCAMIGLNYMGLLPVHDVSEMLPQASSTDHTIFQQPGVSRFFPPASTRPDQSFLFLRDMASVDNRLYVSYGPTCGVFGFDLANGAETNLEFEGTMRHMVVAPDGNHLWGLNWQHGRFLSLNTQPSPSMACAQDLFGMDLKTPWWIIAQNDRIFVSNVTPPVLAELTPSSPGLGCPLTLKRSINFHTNGYTGFTDGAFAMHLDEARNRLYVVVGMLEGTTMMGLLEIDLDTFKVVRELRLPAGSTMEAVPERGTVLLPAYWGPEIYEVNLEQMAIVNTFTAVPSVLALRYDPKRKLIFALSRAAGQMAVIDYATGKTLRTDSVGAKPEAIWLDPDGSRMFLGSGLGILKFDIDTFLPPGDRSTAGAAAP
jgi:hypothetical protein